MASLHRHRLEVDPGGRDPTSQDPNNRYCFAWAAFKSPTRTVHKGNPSMIAWRPGDLYEQRRLCGAWRWYPGSGDVPGVMWNPHNPGDPAYGGWVPENSSGVSAWAVDYFGEQVYPNGAKGLVFRLQGQPSANRHFQLATVEEVEQVRAAGGSFDITLDMDITDKADGSCWVALNGVWKWKLENVKTCWVGQTAYWMYEGCYNSAGVPALQTNSYLPARYGRTPEECLADGRDWPIEEAAVWGAVQRSNPSVAAYRHVQLEPVQTETFRAPEGWGGTVPTPPPPVPTGDFTWTPSTPVPGQEVVFTAVVDLVDPDYDDVVTWDRTLDGIADGSGHTFRYAYASAGEKTVVLMVSGQEVARHALTVIPAPPPVDPLELHIVTQTASTVTIGWTPPAGQQGYVATLDGSQTLTDGKRHASVSKTARQVKIGRKQDGQPHRYGVDVLGVSVSSEVEA